MCDKCPASPTTRYGTDGIAVFQSLRLAMRRKALEITKRLGGVMPLPGNRFSVLPVDRTKPVIVRWRLDHWGCGSCSGRINETKPCFHLVAVLVHLGLMPTAVEDVTPNKIRNQAAFDLAKRNMAQELPKLIAKLCEQVRETRINPVGREAVTVQDLMFGIITYVASGCPMREVESMLKDTYEKGLTSKLYSYPLLSEFLEHPETSMEIQRLQLMLGIASSAFTASAGPDGTGFQRRNFFQYAEDRARWRAQRERKKAERAAVKRGQSPKPSEASPTELDKPRQRGHIQAIPLIAYETNIVLDVHVRAIDPTDDSEDDSESTATSKDEEDEMEGLRGEQPYFLALLERTRPFLPHLRRVRADKGFAKMLNYWWGQCWGIELSIPFKSNFQPGARKNKSGRARKAASRALVDWMMDEEAAHDEYHKRSQQEGVMNGCKVEVGGGVRTRTEQSQLNEVRLKWLVFSLKQTLYLMYGRDGWVPDFAAAAAQLGPDDLVPLEVLAAKYLQKNAEDIIQWEASHPTQRYTQAVLGEGAA